MPDLPSGTVTLLFTDIEDSTRLVQQLGDRYPDVLAAHRQILRETVNAAGGREVDTQGDSFFFAFTRAAPAIRASIAAQHAITGHTWPEDGQIRVRMGLHTGEPLPTTEGYVGLDVHRAARIGDAGHGGQVLLSQATADIVRHDLPEGVRLWDMGERRLRGIPHAEHLFQLVVPGLPETFPPLRAHDPRPSNLPRHMDGPLVGREQELAAARERLRRPGAGLVTCIGPGGAGKTRLALRLAADLLDGFAHGAFFVPLAPVTEPALVVSAIAATLGLRESDSRPLLERLKDELRDRQLLLVLDNFDHVLGAASALDELLMSCPRLKLLVTSRTVLHLRGERQFPVPPLAVPGPGEEPPADITRFAAVQLFVQRARAVRPDFAVTGENAPVLAQLCARLAGLPLAIELAAARVRQLPLRTILSRLERRLALLGTVPDAPAGQRTMRGVIAWSYHLLAPAEQTLARRLAVFVGGFTPEMAETVCNCAGALEVDVRAGIAALVEKRLLRRETPPDDQPRYIMPSTIREYVIERLVGSGEATAVRRGYVACLLALAEETERNLRGAEPGSWPERLATERDNLRAALEWSRAGADPVAALRLAAALEPFWRLRGALTEGRGWLDSALDLATAPTPAVLRARARARAAAGSLARRQRDHQIARARIEESVALWRMLADQEGLGAALELLAAAAADACAFEDARRAAEEAATVARAAEDRWTVAAALYRLGYVALAESDYPSARTRFEESLALYRELEDTWGIAMPLAHLGVVLALQGDRAAGRALLEEGLALAQQAADEPTIATALGYLARLSWLESDFAGTAARAEAWLAVCRRLGDREGAARAEMVLGAAALGRGDGERARARFTASLLRCRELGSALTAAGALAGFASMAAAAGAGRRAARLFGAADTLLRATPASLSPADRIDRDRIAVVVRAGSGAGATRAAWSEGRAMSLDAAIAGALGRT